MGILEQKRALLEDLEIIEEAISSRFQRNPELYYKHLKTLQTLTAQPINIPSSIIISENRVYKTKKVKRNKKQVVLQQTEIKLFLDDYNDKREKLKRLVIYNSDENNIEDNTDILISKFKEDIDNFVELEEKNNNSVLKDKILKYAMFSEKKTRAHPPNILSLRGLNLDVNSVFNREEQYGEYLDLEPFHNKWLNVVRKADISLIQFYSILELFLDKKAYIRRAPMDRKNSRYLEFLSELAEYVESFLLRKYPLIERKRVEDQINEDFEKYLDEPLGGDNIDLFCVPCGKKFKHITVFENHLSGKNHIKPKDSRRVGLLSEYKLHRYLSSLKDELNNSRDYTERKLAFTANERREELERVEKEYHSTVYGENETEDTDKKYNDSENDSNDDALNGVFNMPLGPDGLPMPHWLYKLQGLDVSYSCEICSGQVFQGRRAFEKHFHDANHEYGLRCLGIEPTSNFVGITKIQEAQQLWASMGNDSSVRNVNASKKSSKFVIEVEDAEGNVMTKKVYDELKKQGLA